MNKLSSFWNSILMQMSGRDYPKGLFLHIQKTAGTSIVKIVQEYYRFSMTDHAGHIRKSPDNFRNIKIVSGHFGYDFASHLMRDRFSFTFLREPKERVLSMCYFLRGQKKNLYLIYKVAKKLTLEQFLRAGLVEPMIKKRLWNNQVWQLAHGWENLDSKRTEDFDNDDLISLAVEHLDSFSHVGLTEI